MPYTSLEMENYIRFASMFPEIISNQYTDMLFKQESFDNLSITKVYGGEYSLSLSYVKNGDMMYEPEYRFILDMENEALRITSYTMSSLGIYGEVYDCENPALYKPELKQNCDIGFDDTLKGIEGIKYKLYGADGRDGAVSFGEIGEIEDEDELE